jgi:adenosylcobyric acid synthase
MGREKPTRRPELRDPESSALLRGYEIHHGVTAAGPSVQTLVPKLLWRQGNVRGNHLHGRLENPACTPCWSGTACLHLPR